MKALTLHQPWATAIVLGLKSVETRSWRTDYRGPLTIHAGLTIPPYNDHGVPVSLVPRPDGVVGHFGGVAHPLPLGAIVATCRLVDVVPIVDGHLAEQTHVSIGVPGRRGLYLDTYTPGSGITTRNLYGQRPWGDFTPGRWAWLLDDVKPTTERCPTCWGVGRTKRMVAGLMTDEGDCPVCDERGCCDPVPARGARGLWNWTP